MIIISLEWKTYISTIEWIIISVFPHLLHLLLFFYGIPMPFASAPRVNIYFKKNDTQQFV